MKVLLNRSAEEVAAADAMPWDGPLAWIARPLTYEATVRLWLLGISFNLAAGIGGMALVQLIPDLSPGRRAAIFSVLAAAILMAVVAAAWLLAASPARLRRLAPPTGLAFTVSAPVLISLAIASLGSRGDSFAFIYCQAIFPFYWARPRIAAAVCSLVPAQYGILLWIQPGHPDPLLHWLVLVNVFFGLAVGVGWMASRADRLGDAAIAAQGALHTLNSQLESRVAGQVRELQTLARFRRFLPPQVAEAVAADAEAALAPHRRKIAVFFCDLRGFTAFTNSAEPEDVVGVLDEYFKAVGGVLTKHGATIGNYAGDGIMAFFGDPVPSESPAVDALEMACDLRSTMHSLIARWREQGFELGYGAGIAYGHATLGQVGTDGRFDYTALGSVVNLAARLCAQATHEQILLDRATHLAANSRIPSRDVGGHSLKGFPPDLPVFELA